jgi:hypothetical protein
MKLLLPSANFLVAMTVSVVALTTTIFTPADATSRIRGVSTAPPRPLHVVRLSQHRTRGEPTDRHASRLLGPIFGPDLQNQVESKLGNSGCKIYVTAIGEPVSVCR